MTWLAVLLISAAYLALCLRVVVWVGELLAEASSPTRACECSRHRVCAYCLEDVREGRRAA